MTEESSSVKIEPAIFDRLLKVVVALGSCVSLTYVLGYAYWWGYLDVFGASFLISQVPTITVLFGNVLIVALLALSVLVFLEHKTQPTERSMLRAVAWLTLTLFIVLAVDAFIGTHFLEEERSAAHGIAGLCALAGAMCCGNLALAAWNKNESMSAAKRVCAFAAFAFVAFPATVGLSNGFHDRAHPGRELSVAKLVGQGARTYVLFVTDTHVYCVVEPTERTRRILVVPWSSVLELSSVREVMTHKKVD